MYLPTMFKTSKPKDKFTSTFLFCPHCNFQSAIFTGKIRLRCQPILNLRRNTDFFTRFIFALSSADAFYYEFNRERRGDRRCIEMGKRI